MHEGWRRGGESNHRVKVLQTSALPLGYRAGKDSFIRTISGMEARTGFEPDGGFADLCLTNLATAPRRNQFPAASGWKSIEIPW